VSGKILRRLGQRKEKNPYLELAVRAILFFSDNVCGRMLCGLFFLFFCFRLRLLKSKAAGTFSVSSANHQPQNDAKCNQGR
jgi:hypothetical protein